MPVVCIVIFTNEIINRDLLHHKPLPVFLLLSRMTTNITETEATAPNISPITIPPARLTPTVVYEVNDEHSSETGHVLPDISIKDWYGCHSCKFECYCKTWLWRSNSRSNVHDGSDDLINNGVGSGFNQRNCDGVLSVGSHYISHIMFYGWTERDVHQFSGGSVSGGDYYPVVLRTSNTVSALND